MTIARQKSAFQYINEDKEIRDETNKDRMQCRENYLKYLIICDIFLIYYLYYGISIK